MEDVQNVVQRQSKQAKQDFQKIIQSVLKIHCPKSEFKIINQELMWDTQFSNHKLLIIIINIVINLLCIACKI